MQTSRIDAAATSKQYIAVTLGHRTSISPSVGATSSWKETYSTQAVTLERPDKGRKIHQVVCAKCGQAIEITAVSRRAVDTKRLVYRIVAGSLVLFSTLVYTGTLGGLRPGAISTAQACLAVSAFFAILGAIGLVAQSFQSDKSLAVAIAGPEGHALIHDSK